MNRSALFVPGDKLDLVSKLRQRPRERQPDRIIVDLEDSIAVTSKRAARVAVTDALASGTLSSEVIVRINSANVGLEDIAAVCAVGDPIICVPKADAATVAGVASAISNAGRIPRIWALIESAAGLHDAVDVARTAGVTRLAIGEADLCAELGVQPSAVHALWPLRMQLVTASVLGRLDAPVGPISVDFSDLHTYERDSEALCAAGFGGRLAIHPNQLPAIHGAFTPSPDELHRARQTVDRYAAATAAGDGVIVGDDGRMIDEAIVRAARRVLAAAPPEETT